MFDLDEIEKATKHADRFAKALGDSQKISRSMKQVTSVRHLDLL